MKNVSSENYHHSNLVCRGHTLGYPCRFPITDLSLLLCFSSYRKEIKSRIACLQESTHRTLGNLDMHYVSVRPARLVQLGSVTISKVLVRSSLAVCFKNFSFDREFLILVRSSKQPRTERSLTT